MMLGCLSLFFARGTLAPDKRCSVNNVAVGKREIAARNGRTGPRKHRSERFFYLSLESRQMRTPSAFQPVQKLDQGAVYFLRAFLLGPVTTSGQHRRTLKLGDE
jgi:hypothetical protein